MNCPLIFSSSADSFRSNSAIQESDSLSIIFQIDLTRRSQCLTRYKGTERILSRTNISGISQICTDNHRLIQNAWRRNHVQTYVAACLIGVLSRRRRNKLSFLIRVNPWSSACPMKFFLPLFHRGVLIVLSFETEVSNYFANIG